MTFVKAFGWFSASLSLVTFSMKTMIPLRTAAICSNMASITYGLLLGLYPGVVLNSILLPFNIYRLIEMRRLIKQVSQAAQGDLSVDWLKPFMKKHTVKSGEVLFSRGDKADQLYFLVEGDIRLREIDKSLEPGHLFGEIAFFSPEGVRTNTAECASDATVLRIGESALKQLYFQNPKFGFYLVRLVSSRLSSDIRRLEEKLA